MDITGSAALVTGAASGLGAATAAALAARGAQVVGIDLPSSIERAVDVEGVRLVAADVVDPAQVADAIAAADAPIRVVVNCAGIAPARRVLSSKGVHELELFRRSVEVNLVGTFNVLRLAAEAMAATESVDECGQRGVIITTASVAAFEGQIGQAAYSASKGGVVGMALPIAREFARYGIRVNTIAPGLFLTPLLQSLPQEAQDSLGSQVPFPSRLGKPEEYARMVESIVTNPMLNAEVIRLDGAIRMAPR